MILSRPVDWKIQGRGMGIVLGTYRYTHTYLTLRVLYVYSLLLRSLIATEFRTQERPVRITHPESLLDIPEALCDLRPRATLPEVRYIGTEVRTLLHSTFLPAAFPRPAPHRVRYEIVMCPTRHRLHNLQPPRADIIVSISHDPPSRSLSYRKTAISLESRGTPVCSAVLFPIPGLTVASAISKDILIIIRRHIPSATRKGMLHRLLAL